VLELLLGLSLNTEICWLESFLTGGPIGDWRASTGSELPALSAPVLTSAGKIV